MDILVGISFLLLLLSLWMGAHYLVYMAIAFLVGEIRDMLFGSMWVRLYSLPLPMSIIFLIAAVGGALFLLSFDIWIITEFMDGEG